MYSPYVVMLLVATATCEATLALKRDSITCPLSAVRPSIISTIDFGFVSTGDAPVLQ